MRRLPALFACLLASPAWAGDLVGYVAGSQASIDRFDRFPNGIANPTPNASGSFVGAGLDLSGIGWLTGNPTFAVSLIAAVPSATPTDPAVGRYILGAAHVGFGANVTFADNQGVTHTYSVTGTQRLTTNGVPSDILIGRLSANVPAGDGVKPLPLAQLTPATAVGLEAFAYTQNTAYGSTGPNGTGDPTRRQLGLATIGSVEQVDFGAGNSPTMDAVWQRDPGRTGSVLLTGGDSGGPLFTRGQNGETALIGGHMGADAGQGISVSSFLPEAEYVTQLNQFMGVDGYQVLFAPVPEPAGLLAAAAAVAGVWWRKRSHRRQALPAGPDGGHQPANV